MFLLISTGILGIVPAFIPLQDAGMTAVEAGSIASILGISVLVGRLAIGFAVDNFFAPYVTAITFTLVALGCLALGLGGTSFAVLAAITIGFAVGAEVAYRLLHGALFRPQTLCQHIWRSIQHIYLGRRHQPDIGRPYGT